MAQVADRCCNEILKAQAMPSKTPSEYDSSFNLECTGRGEAERSRSHRIFTKFNVIILPEEVTYRPAPKMTWSSSDQFGNLHGLHLARCLVHEQPVGKVSDQSRWMLMAAGSHRGACNRDESERSGGETNRCIRTLIASQ